MTRLAPVLLIAALTAAPGLAADPIEVGKATPVEFTEKTRFANLDCYRAFEFPADEGDRFKIEVVPAGGEKFRLTARLYQKQGAVEVLHEQMPGWGAKVGWTTTKGAAPGTVRLEVVSNLPGKATLLVTRATGAAPLPAGATLEDRVLRLERENEELRQQLAELRRLLPQKK